MNTRKHKALNIAVTGALVLVITLTALFWIRWFTESTRLSLLGEPEFMIRPSGLLPWESDIDPNRLFAYSAVTGQIWARRVPDVSLGPVAYWQSRRPEGPDSPVYVWDAEPGGTRVYYDKSLGLIVHQATERVTQPDGSYEFEQVVRYAGPFAVVDTPTREVQRFEKRPVLVRDAEEWVFYQSDKGRLCAIDWKKRPQVRGETIAVEGNRHPVQFLDLRKQSDCLGVWFQSPRAEQSEMTAELEKLYPGLVIAGDQAEPEVRIGEIWDEVFVLDASGAIERLNLETLQIDRQFVGWLPRPETLFSSSESNVRTRPDDVLAYRVVPIGIQTKQRPRQSRYLGCAVGTLSRDGTGMEVRVFDPNGRAVVSTRAGFGNYRFHERRASFHRDGYLPSVRAAYDGLPGAGTLTMLKVLTESLHPPVLLLASFFTARDIEATAGWRALFLTPNSLVAMRARTPGLGVGECFILAIPLLFPSLVIMTGLFALLVSRDARRIGLSRIERKLWIFGIVVFGLPAYVTYRLTRPGGVLVTCANCGARRRPDQERCHFCNSRWNVPELNPPAWRVLDGGHREFVAPPAGIEPAPAAPIEEKPPTPAEEDPPVE